MDYLRKAVGDARAESKNNRETNGFQSVNGSTGLPQFTHTGSDNRWSMQSLVRTCFLLLSCMLMISGPVFAEDAMFIDEDGNVGIGTTSPGATLDVAGDGASTELRLSETAGGGNEDIIGTIDFFEGHYKHVSIAKIQGVRDPGANDGRIGFLTTLKGEQSEKMRINSNGNVGIGTTNPEHPLDVVGRIRSQGTAAGIWVGDTMFVGEHTADNMGFFTGNQWRMVLTNSGNVGIGTTEPKAPLEVKGHHYMKLTDSPDGFSNNNGFNNWGGLGTPGGGKFQVSILSENWIAGAGMVANSDRRIKEIVGQSDTAKDLEIVQKLRVTEYHPIDKMAQGNSLRRGFVAQEVMEVLPQAVASRRDVIPDIYSMATDFAFDQNQKTLSITLPRVHELIKGQVVQIITEDGSETVTVVAVPTTFSFVVGEFEKQPKQVFVYGCQVDDFLSLHYEQIFTTGIGAIQELKKILESKDAEVKALQDENAALRSQLAEQDNRLFAIEKTVLALSTNLPEEKLAMSH